MCVKHGVPDDAQVLAPHLKGMGGLAHRVVWGGVLRFADVSVVLWELSARDPVPISMSQICELSCPQGGLGQSTVFRRLPSV